MKTIINRKDLADRWDTNVTTIDGWEKAGVIKRLPKFPTPRYSMADVEKAESTGMDNLIFKKDKEIRRLKEEITELRSLIEKTKMILSI